jgi:hypothetical protein
MLKNRKEIECYEEVMESRPIYPKIWWYNFIQDINKRAQEYFHIIEVKKDKEE